MRERLVKLSAKNIHVYDLTVQYDLAPYTLNYSLLSLKSMYKLSNRFQNYTSDGKKY